MAKSEIFFVNPNTMRQMEHHNISLEEIHILDNDRISVEVDLVIISFFKPKKKNGENGSNFFGD